MRAFRSPPAWNMKKMAQKTPKPEGVLQTSQPSSGHAARKGSRARQTQAPLLESHQFSPFLPCFFLSSLFPFCLLCPVANPAEASGKESKSSWTVTVKRKRKQKLAADGPEVPEEGREREGRGESGGPPEHDSAGNGVSPEAHFLCATGRRCVVSGDLFGRPSRTPNVRGP